MFSDNSNNRVVVSSSSIASSAVASTYCSGSLFARLGPVGESCFKMAHLKSRARSQAKSTHSRLLYVSEFLVPRKWDKIKKNALLRVGNVRETSKHTSIRLDPNFA